jgi:hypothetical protein
MPALHAAPAVVAALQAMPGALAALPGLRLVAEPGLALGREELR